MPLAALPKHSRRAAIDDETLQFSKAVSWRQAIVDDSQSVR